MRVVVLYNEASQDANVDEQDILAQRDAVTAALQELGHRALPVSCTLDLDVTRRQLEDLRPDVVFNLVEALGGTDRLMPAATLLLEALHIPYTGNPTQSILATSNKLGAKQKLRDAELPTAEWWVGNGCQVPGSRLQPEDDRGGRGRGGETNDLVHFDFSLPLSSREGRGEGLRSSSPRPRAAAPRQSRRRHDGPSDGPIHGDHERVIVKAVWEHASFNMDDDAVIPLNSTTPIEEILRERDELTGRPHFAEKYIDGREFNLTLIAGSNGPLVLPPAEIDFDAYPDGKPRIVGYKAKWCADSFEFENTPRRFDFCERDQPLLDKLSELSACCWYLFDLRGTRVDFRVDESGRPWILEVNANPCLAPDAGFAAAVDRAEIGYNTAISRILNDALRSV